MSDQHAPSTDNQLDARGLYCPEPVMMLHKKIRELAPGEEVTMVATDPSTTRDVPKFCHFLEHELVRSWEQDELFYFTIRKGGA